MRRKEVSVGVIQPETGVGLFTLFLCPRPSWPHSFCPKTKRRPWAEEQRTCECGDARKKEYKRECNVWAHAKRENSKSRFLRYESPLLILHWLFALWYFWFPPFTCDYSRVCITRSNMLDWVGTNTKVARRRIAVLTFTKAIHLGGCHITTIVRHDPYQACTRERKRERERERERGCCSVLLTRLKRILSHVETKK